MNRNLRLMKEYEAGMRAEEIETRDWYESHAINHPPHYTHLPVEAIEITEHFNFCMGNALKYIIRADHKGNPVEDLRKAVWYLNREIERRLDADVQL